jgi:hypothetical protein
VNSSGTLTVLAGNGYAGFSGDGGLATESELYNPQGIAVDHAGNVFIADESNCAVREVPELSTVTATGYTAGADVAGTLLGPPPA